MAIVATTVAGISMRPLVPTMSLLIFLPFPASLVDDVARILAAVGVATDSSALAFAPVCPTGLRMAVNHVGARMVPGADGRGLLPLLGGGRGHHIPDPCHGCDGRVPFAEHGNEGVHEHPGGDEVLLRRAEDVRAC